MTEVVYEQKVQTARERFDRWIASLPRVEDGVLDQVEERRAAQRRVLARLDQPSDLDALFLFQICFLDFCAAEGLLQSKVLVVPDGTSYISPPSTKEPS